MDLQDERAKRFIEVADRISRDNRGKRLHADRDPDMQMLSAEIRAIQVALDYLPEPSKKRAELLRRFSTAHRRLAMKIAEVAEREELALVERQGERVAHLV